MRRCRGFPQAARRAGRPGATERQARRRTTSHTSARASGTRGKPHREAVHKFSTCPCRLLEASGSESGEASGLPEDQSRETIEAPRAPGFSARVESRFQRHGARRPKPAGKPRHEGSTSPPWFGESKHTSVSGERSRGNPPACGRETHPTEPMRSPPIARDDEDGASTRPSGPSTTIRKKRISS